MGLIVDPYANAVSTGRPRGAIIVDGQHVADTVMCAHCGQHFVMEKGSGRVRGWCAKCDSILCGGANCRACIPLEKRLDIRERNGMQNKFGR